MSRSFCTDTEAVPQTEDMADQDLSEQEKTLGCLDAETDYRLRIWLTKTGQNRSRPSNGWMLKLVRRLRMSGSPRQPQQANVFSKFEEPPASNESRKYLVGGWKMICQGTKIIEIRNHALDFLKIANLMRVLNFYLHLTVWKVLNAKYNTRLCIAIWVKIVLNLISVSAFQFFFCCFVFIVVIVWKHFLVFIFVFLLFSFVFFVVVFVTRGDLILVIYYFIIIFFSFIKIFYFYFYKR